MSMVLDFLPQNLEYTEGLLTRVENTLTFKR